MDAQSTVWNIRAQECQRKLATIPGDALLTAAGMLYFGCIQSSSRTSLMKDWMKRCKLNDFSVCALVTQISQGTARNQGSSVSNGRESELRSENTGCSDDFVSLNSPRDSASNSSVHSYHQSVYSVDLTQERVIAPGTEAKLDSNPMNDDLLALRDNFTIEGILIHYFLLKYVMFNFL